MRNARAVAVSLPLVAAFVAAACAPAPKREAHWVTSGGAPADRAAVRAAADACAPKIDAATRPGLYKGTVEWGVRMLDCLRESGFVLIYEDPEQITPEPSE